MLGIAFPIQLNKRDDLAQQTDVELDVVNMTLLLGTEKGECEWDGDFGMSTKRLKHMKQSVLVGRAIAIRDATDAIKNYYSNYVVTNAKTETSESEAKVSIEVAPRANLEDRMVIETEV